ncbi:MAG: hypothetical protein JNL74_00405, partial [Fibrobacteres bacterium]|nr:hypothetical protein [Fibrobacterota bacterium]
MYKVLIVLAFVALLFPAVDGMNFSNTDIRDVAKSLSVVHNVNIIVDQDIDLKVTIYLQALPLNGLLDALTRSYNLSWIREGDVYRITKNVEELEMTVNITPDSIKNIVLKNVKLKDFVDALNKQAPLNLLLEKGLKGKISGSLQAIALKDGLKALLEANGYTLKKKGDVHMVALGDGVDEEGKPVAKPINKPKKFDMEVEDGKVNLKVSGADLGEVLKELAEEAGLNFITYDQVKGSVDAMLQNKPVQEVIQRLLAGTRYTYTVDDGILLVGERNATTPSGEALSQSKLIHLRHVKADNVPTILPKSIPVGNVQVIKEQNGILVMGTQVLIKQVENFLNEIDVPTPQISIECIIAEFYTDNGKDIGLRATSKTTRDSTLSLGGNLIPGLSYTTGKAQIEKTLGFKFGSIGILPDNFMLTLKALETDKLARVLAKPRIVTLNGSKASINVGTSMYYKVTTGNVETPLTR